MSLYARIQGVINSFFQFGGPGGAGFNKVSANAIETKDSTNTTFANLRGASPIVDADFVTKMYSDLQSKPIPVGLQLDGNNLPPNNSATEQYYVFTTSGPNGQIGQLAWDNGLNDATPVVVFATPTVAVGYLIAITAPLLGGTITFPTANQIWIWNGSPQQWNLITAGSVATPGIEQVISFLIGSVNQVSGTSLPANALVSRCDVVITSVYNAGATIMVGLTGVGNSNEFQDLVDNQPTTLATYQADQNTLATSATQILCTIAGVVGGTPAGRVTVWYSVPQN